MTLTVFGGSLVLPARSPRAEDEELRPFPEPEHAPALEVEAVSNGPVGRKIRRDLATGLVEQVFDWDLGGAQRLVPIDLETEDASQTTYSVVEGEPLSASVRFHAATGMARDGWRTRAEVESEMTADAEAFHVTTRLQAFEGETPVFERSWTFRFLRDHV